MKAKSVTFFCDVAKCRQRYTALADDDHAGAYIDLVEAGWKVDRIVTGWKHYCPEHVQKESRS